MGFLDILIFALIAVFLIFRLGGVLGRRTGHERQPGDIFRRRERDGQEAGDDNVVPLPEKGRAAPVDAPPAPAADTPLGRGLADIARADGDFSSSGFLEGARGAFEMVLEAFANGDGKTLKMLLADDVYESFAEAIRAREKAGEQLQETLVGIDSAEIVDARLDGKTALVTVKFQSQQVTALVDADGKVIEGDPNAVVGVTDLWTFARDTTSRDPNWVLVETRTPE